MGDHPDKQVGNRDKSVQWYTNSLDTISESTRDVLENYSKIPKDEVLPHCLKVRDEAWDVFPYPCIGQFRFLDLSIGSSNAYPEILERMKSGKQNYLDLGCCFGQDIRRLVNDGAPSENCYGSDLRLDFMELGYDLFLDKKTLKSEFIAGDVFDPESKLKALEGKIDVIHAAAFFHLFSLDEQKSIALRVLRLWKPQGECLLVGRQVGNSKAGEFPHRTNPNSFMFRHDIESWKAFWKNIGDEAGVRLEVQAEFYEWPHFESQAPTWRNDGAKRLQFTIRRL